MNPAKIVVREIEGKRGFQIAPLLRKGIGQAGKSANRGSHAEIDSLNNAGADSSRVRVSDHRLRYCFHHFGWRILLLTFWVAIAVDLNQHRVINASAKRIAHSVFVRSESVCGQLETSA